MSVVTELYVGSFIRRSDGVCVRVMRVKGTMTYKGYVGGVLTVTGTRSAAMELVTA